ncbi:MAG: transglutaminase-like domain-containing protein [Planctomycetaceae bacterium]
MKPHDEFPHDVEFRKLLCRASDIDLTLVALEIARDANPRLDFGHTLEWIAKRGREFGGPMARSASDRVVLKELARCLAGQHGLHGDRGAFERAESSYVNRVIETGLGIPISLSLVYVAVAQAAGLELVGVAAPMHFLTRYDALEGPLFLDAFHQGQVIEYDECLQWLQSLSGLAVDEVESLLEPASPREIIIRLLNNLKAVTVRQEEWAQAWLVQRRLSALHPGAYDQQRDLAYLAMKAHHPGNALDVLEGCLKDCPDQDRPLLINQLRAAEQQIAELN